jgi:phage baseplate assembly protein W
MNQGDGKAISDADHLRQSARDILLTPQKSRMVSRE